MQFEIDDTKFMPPSIAEVLCREILGIPISSTTSDHMDFTHVKMGKPKKPSKGNPRAEVVIGVQFGAFRDTAIRLNEKTGIPVSKEKVMADTIKNLVAKVDRLQEESDKRGEALASALEESNKRAEALASARQFIERLQCTR